MRVIVVVAALLGQTAFAAACSCPQATVEDLIDDRRDLAIFSARVVSVLSPEKGKPTVTRFQVGDVIKGDVPRIVEMTGVAIEDTPCGVDFRPGEVRTLAAYRRDGRWFTDRCLIPRP